MNARLVTPPRFRNAPPSPITKETQNTTTPTMPSPPTRPGQRTPYEHALARTVKTMADEMSALQKQKAEAEERAAAARARAAAAEERTMALDARLETYSSALRLRWAAMRVVQRFADYDEGAFPSAQALGAFLAQGADEDAAYNEQTREFIEELDLDDRVHSRLASAMQLLAVEGRAMEDADREDEMLQALFEATASYQRGDEAAPSPAH